MMGVGGWGEGWQGRIFDMYKTFMTEGITHNL